MAEGATTGLSTYEIEDHIIESLRKRDGVATAGDVAADTGLPYEEVERVLRRMLQFYRSHLDVDDSGNLRYRFDPSFPRRGEDRGRFWHRLRKGAQRFFMGFFKVWTMVMLVGYTATFLLALMAAGIGAMGLTLASGDEGGGGLAELGFLPFYFALRILEFMFWVSLLSDRPGHGILGRKLRRRKRRPEKPFYQKIFQYLFGPPETKEDPLEPQRAFAGFVRSRKGTIAAADWASRTGKGLDSAENALTASVVRFNGNVEMSDEGTMVYRFPDLRLSADEQAKASEAPPAVWEREAAAPPLTGNPRRTNVWITILNGFNLAMSSFLVAGLPGASVPGGIAALLGWVPLSFSLIFFGIPVVRWLKRRKAKKRAQKENRWRALLQRIYESVQDGEAQPIPDSEVPEEFQGEVVTAFDGYTEHDDQGNTWYRFPRLAAELDAARRAREEVGSGDRAFGRTVFSSDENAQQPEDQSREELDDFDRRLARELQG